MSEKKDWKQQLEGSLDDLKAMGKDIAERLETTGRGAMDEAKETWKKLEPQLGQAEETLRHAGEDAVDHVKGLFGKLEGSLKKLRDKM